MSAAIEDLAPSIRDKCRKLCLLLDAAGIAYRVIETRRTLAVQKAYFAQGREPFEEVNAKRRDAGLWEISFEESRRVVTRTLNSRHLSGEAFDLVPLDSRGALWWGAPAVLWRKVGELAETVGLEWGGRWDATPGKLGWDCPHFQERG